jgi:hypothetical protein
MRWRWLLCFGDAADRLFLIWTRDRDLALVSTLNSLRAHAVKSLAPPFLVHTACIPNPETLAAVHIDNYACSRSRSRKVYVMDSDGRTLLKCSRR